MLSKAVKVAKSGLVILLMDANVEAIVLCLEPPIAQFGSLILKVVTVPTPSFHFKI